MSATALAGFVLRAMRRCVWRLWRGGHGSARKWPAGWAQDLRRKPLIPNEPRDYCPDHIALATV
jgi:hypothetical protein